MARKVTIILEAVAAGIKGTFKRFSKEFESLKKDIAAFGQTVWNSFKKAMGILVAFGGGLIALAKQGNAFRKEMAAVAVQLDSGDAGLRKMSDGIRDLSMQTGLATSVLAKGLKQALTAGVPEDNALSFLASASKAAIAGGGDVVDVVDEMTTIMNAYNLKATDGEKIASKLFATVKGGKTSFEGLGKRLGETAVVGARLGVSLDDIGGAVVAMTRQGIPASKALGAINAALMALMKPKAGLKKVLEDAGLTGPALIATKGFQGALQWIADAAGGAAGGIAELAGSAGDLEGLADSADDAEGAVSGLGLSGRALAAVYALTGQNAALAKEGIDAVTNSAGKLDEAFAKQDAVRGWDKAMMTAKAGIVEIGLVAEQLLTPAIEKATAAVRNWIQDGGFELLVMQVKLFAEAAIVEFLKMDAYAKGVFGAIGKVGKNTFGYLGGLIGSYGNVVASAFRLASGKGSFDEWKESAKGFIGALSNFHPGDVTAEFDQMFSDVAKAEDGYQERVNKIRDEYNEKEIERLKRRADEAIKANQQAYVNEWEGAPGEMGSDQRAQIERELNALKAKSLALTKELNEEDAKEAVQKRKEKQIEAVQKYIEKLDEEIARQKAARGMTFEDFVAKQQAQKDWVKEQNKMQDREKRLREAMGRGVKLSKADQQFIDWRDSVEAARRKLHKAQMDRDRAEKTVERVQREIRDLGRKQLTELKIIRKQQAKLLAMK